MELEQRAAAKEHFRQLHEPSRATVLQHFDELENAPHRSPAWCGFASAVLPGAGQVISGRTADGAVAFLTNGVLLGGSAVAFHNDEEVTGAALGFLGIGFYLGNVFAASTQPNNSTDAMNRVGANDSAA